MPAAPATLTQGTHLDTIFIERLAVDTVIGVYDWERNTRQRVFIDLDIDFDIRDAAADDAVAQTLDYKAVADRVGAFVRSARFRLVETLAEEVARLVMTEFDVDLVAVGVDKPQALPNARSVGVRIVRRREP